MIVAHKSADGRLQPLEEHLRNVAEYAKRFSEVFEAGEYAYVLGLAHDIGKYSAEFQEYLLHEGTGGDHSTAGAKELFRLRMLPAYSIGKSGIINKRIDGLSTDMPWQRDYDIQIL